MHSTSRGLTLSAPRDGAVAAARDLADRLLRSDAELVDSAAVRRSTLDTLAAAGLYGLTAPVEAGGLGQPPAVGREVAELLAGACGSTWFVWTQHSMPLAMLLHSGNEQLQGERLARMIAGKTQSGVAYAHLRRAGAPAVTATRSQGGWTLSGSVDWLTGWGLVDVFLVAAATDNGQVVFALVPAADSPGLTASGPLRLAAMQGTSTVRLTLDRLHVPDGDIVAVLPLEVWRADDALRTANAAPHLFGLHREIVRRLRDAAEHRGDRTAARVADRLGEAGERTRTEAYRLIDEVPADERLEERLALRAASLDLAVRGSTALVTATGGRAMSADNSAQRLAREALFYLVQAQTPPVREATLRRIADCP